MLTRRLLLALVIAAQSVSNIDSDAHAQFVTPAVSDKLPLLGLCDLNGEWILDSTVSDPLDPVIDVLKLPPTNKIIMRAFKPVVGFKITRCYNRLFGKLDRRVQSEITSMNNASYTMSSKLPYGIVKKGTFEIGGSSVEIEEEDIGVWNVSSYMVNGWLIQKRVSNVYGNFYDGRAVFSLSELMKLSNETLTSLGLVRSYLLKYNEKKIMLLYLSFKSETQGDQHLKRWFLPYTH